jgi:hypothetical protein
MRAKVKAAARTIAGEDQSAKRCAGPPRCDLSGARQHLLDAVQQAVAISEHHVVETRAVCVASTVARCSVSR